MSFWSHVTAIIFTLSTALSAAAPAAGALLPGGADRWQLTWSDEFDYPDTELETRWVSQNGPSGHILSSRWRENAKVSDGTLKLINKKEKRGGQEWTSGNLWTKQHFQYGYYECRYRYAAAEGTNNSFWIMTMGPQPAGKKAFEIDINEGHFPNEVNTNIHNHSDVTIVNGKKTHPSSSKSFAFGARPDVTIQLEIPIKAKRVRLTSNHPSQFHLGEFRIFGVHAAGYPAPFSPDPNKDQQGLINHAKNSKITTSGSYQNVQDTSKYLVDGDPAKSWISQAKGPKFVEFNLPETTTIGCIQFLNGWKYQKKWTGMMDDYRVEYHNGSRWVEIAKFNIHEGNHNFARDYQTYGLEWTEQELIFYFNGKEIRREENKFCHQPAPVWLSLAIIGWAGKISDKIDGTFMEVDYVRIYQKR
jgi:beta-glucanase (GH16 family)